MKQIDIRDFTNYHYPTIFTPAPDGKHAVMAVVDANEKDNCYESHYGSMIWRQRKRPD